jgi:hypothetical protein
MGTPLRVLIIEDSEDDTLLIMHELKRGGYDPKYERVETAGAMPVEDVILEMGKGKGSQFDPQIFEIFLNEKIYQ